jgi:RHS repeat-associated protein
VWDGSSILREERRPYPDGAISGVHFGIIENIHGLELDHPLAVSDQSSARVLNANWRGLFESSVTPSGDAADCSLGTGSCTHIMWPAGQPVYSRTPPVEAGTIVYTFAGNLVTDQQDASGHLFRRNRYYDPMAGRFTQEDPIGMAGGLNVYGFAGGNPVSYSDPFGLCPPADSDVQTCADVQYWRQAAQNTSSIFGKNGNSAMAGLAAMGEAVKATLKGEDAGGCGTQYLCGEPPVVGGAGGEGLLGGMAKALKKAQGVEVSFSSVGKFTRAVWEVAGDKGAGFVKWNAALVRLNRIT